MFHKLLYILQNYNFYKYHYGKFLDKIKKLISSDYY